MDTIDELLANNRTFAEPLADRHLDVQPSRRLAIVTCMDSRLDVFAALGLGAPLLEATLQQHRPQQLAAGVDIRRRRIVRPLLRHGSE